MSIAGLILTFRNGCTKPRFEPPVILAIKVTHAKAGQEQAHGPRCLTHGIEEPIRGPNSGSVDGWHRGGVATAVKFSVVGLTRCVAMAFADEACPA